MNVWAQHQPTCNYQPDCSSSSTVTPLPTRPTISSNVFIAHSLYLDMVGNEARGFSLFTTSKEEAPLQDDVSQTKTLDKDVTSCFSFFFFCWQKDFLKRNTRTKRLNIGHVTKRKVCLETKRFNIGYVNSFQKFNITWKICN
ncbi:hypothetical protein TNCV_4896791 [Trichonephila clavipes]|uniref:Uncharacterized protein n=1 Tax=Trichonephila clavipes TaxID=2585209 RepID=A0A8X6VWX8_TRICX|nr:hypothetical protein TNCV_4896791 [Trichonephila clavipes]